MAAAPQDDPPRTPLHGRAEIALRNFRACREDLVSQVRRGRLTAHVARERAAAAAAALRHSLYAEAEALGKVLNPLLDRLGQVVEDRKKAATNPSREFLQSETNRLLRLSLLEQQLASRSGEFEARTFVRPLSGGTPAPTLDTLVSFHDRATGDGDDAAREWARRRLEEMRPRVQEAEALLRIDAACERPENVSLRAVEQYIRNLTDAPTEALERFVAEALTNRDASACCAAFALARGAAAGTAARWIRDLVEGLEAFPSAALEQLGSWEAEARTKEQAAVRRAVEQAADLAEAEARLPGLIDPTDAQLAVRRRIGAKPIAAADEPIGLTLDRRGHDAIEADGRLVQPSPRGAEFA